MQSILINHNGGQPRLSLHGFAALAAVLVALFGAGYALGRTSAPVTVYAGDLPELLGELRVELNNQRAELHASREEWQGAQLGLARHFGRIQAQLMRLNAAGKRLTEVAMIDADEFQFDDDPGQGGPAPLEGPAALPSEEALAALEADLERKQRQYDILEHLLLAHQLNDQRHPQGWPVESGWISSNFGYRTDPLSGRRSRHSGMDFAARPGVDVRAVAAGVVSFSGRRAAYGNMVEINHGNGYVTRYAHNRRNLVRVGDSVERGQAIALVGSTGRSTGPHVHLEVLVDGVKVDPIHFVSSR